MEVKYRVGFFDYDSFADAELDAINTLGAGYVAAVPIKKIILDGDKVKLGGTFYVNQLYVNQKKG